MKIKLKSYSQKLDDREQWHRWFAWHPVRLDDHTIVWLVMLERRMPWIPRVPKYPGPMIPISWEYRLPGGWIVGEAEEKANHALSDGGRKPAKEGQTERLFVRNGEAGTGSTQQEGWLDISDLQLATGTWADETFPQSSPDSIIAHFREEAHEFADGSPDKDPGDPEEAADCLLLLLHHAHKCGYSLLDEAAKKFRKNRMRKWATKPNAEGYFKHTQEAGDAKR